MSYTFKHGDQPLEGITIQRAAGRGGFGEVYYALTDSGKQIALKYLRNNPEVELRGVTQVMNLKSPHLITIYDVKRSKAGEPFVLMEYVTGPSLTDLLQAAPEGIGPQKAAFFIKGLAAGLSYLHDRGIVHRDLKPGNVFYDDGYVKIGDYGLSKHLSLSAHSGNTISVGTVHYMAPEIGSGNYSKSIDIYSLGVMLYEMLTGRLPYRGSSMGEVLMRHLSDEPDLTGIAEPFARVIKKALAKKPEDRYADVNEMVDALVSVTDVSESLASFDASVLTRMPRASRDDEGDPQRTMTQAPQLPPLPQRELDARELTYDPNDPIPAIPEIPGKLGPRPPRARKAGAKLREQAGKLHQKLGKLGGGEAVLEPATEPTASARHRRHTRKRWGQLFVTTIVVFAVSAGLGLYYENSFIFAATLLWMLLGTAGILLAYVFNGRHHHGEYTFYDRVIYGACGFLFLLPGLAPALAVKSDDFARIMIPLCATLLLFNWTERINVGRKRQLDGGVVFWHGVAGFVIGVVFGAGTEEHVLALIGLVAAQLVAVQSLAAFWPLGAPAPPASELPIEGAAPRQGFRHAVRRADQRIAAEFDRAAAAHAGAAQPAKAGKKKDGADAQRTDATEAKPSFVGQAASAGTSFIAKLLLLGGLTAALLFNGEFNMDEKISTGFAYADGQMQVLYPDEGIDWHWRVPKQVLLIPLVLGTLMLIGVRSNTGSAHFLRGFFGALAALLAALMALNSAAAPLEEFLTGNWGKLNADNWRPLYPVFALTGAALLLLFYPRKRTGPKPIVI